MQSSNINELFNQNTYRFAVPVYQRAYSWEDTQTKQFIQDLKDTAANYSLGHFLFEKDPDNPKILNIIDGQQRLTTIIIFLSALSDILKKRDDISSVDPVSDIDHVYLRDLIKKTCKFSTVDYDNNYFIKYVIDRVEPIDGGIVDSSSQRNIKNAMFLFRKEIESTPTAELERWFALLSEAAITRYTVDNKIQATQIFAFQNDRGKRLSNLEVLKAYMMLQIYLKSDSEELQSENISYLEQEFKRIYMTLVRLSADEDSVLNYFWRSFGSKGYYSENAVSEIKEYISKSNDIIGTIKSLTGNLSQAFAYVEEIEQSSRWELCNLRDLRRMAPAYPLLLKSKRVGASDEDFMRMVRLLENLLFRAAVRGGRAGIDARLGVILNSFSNAAEINQAIDCAIERIKTDGWWSYWNDQELHRSLSNPYIYGHGIVNYILWRYEQSLCPRDYPSPKGQLEDYISQKSIEHIAPQTENPENGYGAYEDEKNPANGIISGEWLNCLGNLLLIGQRQNSSLGNRPFCEKLHVYINDNLLWQQKEVEYFVENPAIWNAQSIERRQNHVVTTAMKIWSLDNI